MKDLSKGTISIKGFSFEVTTSRPETYLGILPQPSDFVPQVVTTTRAIKLEEHKVDFENNLDLSPDEVQSTNKVVLEMFTSLINASVALTQAMQAGQVQQRYYNAEESKNAYDAQWHQCTSGNSILGGGPCCDAIGHWVTPVYKEEDEKEEDYTMCKYCGYPDDHCKCGCAYYD